MIHVGLSAKQNHHVWRLHYACVLKIARRVKSQTELHVRLTVRSDGEVSE